LAKRIIRLTDRSRTTTDWRCPRARYWGYEHGRWGIKPESTSLALSTGTIIHDALAAIATYTRDGEEVPIDTLGNLVFQQMELLLTPEDIVSTEAVAFAKEQASLAEGMIRGFYKYVWPRLLGQFPKIVAVEQEVEYTLDDSTIFMAKPDLLVEDHAGDLIYIEYKSTSSKQDKWINSWDTAVQLHSSIKAVEETLGRAPSYVQIVGLYKGYESYGKQNSPFCYAYLKKGNPPFTQDTIAYEFRSGLRRYPTWELSGGVKKWVEDMPDEVLGSQFPMTAPIMVNETLVETFFTQLRKREAVIAGGGDIDEIFPQRFDQCVPSFGFPCEFRKLCHGGITNPLEAGFTLREPHHKREMEALREETV
jgi:PD-(D/E)XK nuclease superfamily